jgi:hypothetical protein
MRGPLCLAIRSTSLEGFNTSPAKLRNLATNPLILNRKNQMGGHISCRPGSRAA